MRLLLDTHIALWFWNGDAQLSTSLKQAIQDPANEVVFYQASTLEIQIKYQLGKLELPEPPERFLPSAIQNALFRYQAITDTAIFFLARLPFLHRDPFDRLLISFAITEGLTIGTVDPRISQYAVPTLQ